MKNNDEVIVIGSDNQNENDKSNQVFDIKHTCGVRDFPAGCHFLIPLAHLRDLGVSIRSPQGESDTAHISQSQGTALREPAQSDDGDGLDQRPHFGKSV